MATAPKAGVAASESKGKFGLQKQLTVNPEFGAVQLQTTHRHHANSDKRRPKSLEELIAGAELIELADRAHPGRLAGRR